MQNTGFAEIIRLLNEGVVTLLNGLKPIPEARLKSYFAEFENVLGFLETLSFIQETMSSERLQDTLHNAIYSLRKSIDEIPRKILTQIPDLPLDSKTGLPEFILQTIHQMGPHIRISGNEMSAWVRVNSEEASLFSTRDILTCLQNAGITKGIREEHVQDIFENKRFDEEVCVAKGIAPVMGKDGYIRYTVEIDDLGQKPKHLSEHKVSFKDIRLFEYISEGDVLADKIPPQPGKPGFTVKGRILAPLEAQEAVFPQLNYTRISDDDRQLLVTENCCISKKNGVINLDPCLKVNESVSYKTGNISSKVAVIVSQDILANFAVLAEKDVHVNGIVEGAHLETKGNITVKGGIQGQEKAVIESNGDITTRFISNANITCLGSVVTESEIVNSNIQAGGQVIVSGQPGAIIGGEVNSDSDIAVNVIGSDMGVKTVIRLGGRTEDLATLLRENQDKMSDQDEAFDKCCQILDVLKQRESQSNIPADELTKAKQKAQDMLAKARNNLDELYRENHELQKQYEHSLRQSRTVRVRETIFPGAIIQIQGAEWVVHKPTGPVTLLKQGDAIIQLPYQDIKNR